MILNKADLRFYIKKDLDVRGLQRPPLFYKHRNPLIYYTFLLRKVEFIQNTQESMLGKMRCKALQLKLKRLGAHLGLTIPPNTCGPGLFIVHWGSIVISSKSLIGQNCRIHSCVNVGETSNGAPILGDNVYIGPGAKIFGGIIIGKNVTIGANAVVNKSFPDNVVLAGIPAKIIKTF